LPQADDRVPQARVDELAFLNEIAQLATQARDWDELMRSIVDGTTAAMGWRSARSISPAPTARA
jgi:hypothetical protein